MALGAELRARGNLDSGVVSKCKVTSAKCRWRGGFPKPDRRHTLEALVSPHRADDSGSETALPGFFTFCCGCAIVGERLHVEGATHSLEKESGVERFLPFTCYPHESVKNRCRAASLNRLDQAGGMGL
jgi:hypothetical protein